jgi:hypothetical protein
MRCPKIRGVRHAVDEETPQPPKRHLCPVFVVLGGVKVVLHVHYEGTPRPAYLIGDEAMIREVGVLWECFAAGVKFTLFSQVIAVWVE